MWSSHGFLSLSEHLSQYSGCLDQGAQQSPYFASSLPLNLMHIPYEPYSIVCGIERSDSYLMMFSSLLRNVGALRKQLVVDDVLHFSTAVAVS